MAACLGFLAALGSTLLWQQDCGAASGGDLLSPADSAAAPPDTTGAIVRSRNVTVDISRLRGRAGERLSIPTFGGEVLSVLLVRRDEPAADRLFWYGRVENDAASSVTLFVNGKVLIGSIVTGRGRLYQIRYLSGGVHRLQEVDRSRLPQDKESRGAKPAPATKATCSTDPPGDIDVLVVYTQAARDRAGGRDAIEGTILLAMAETNQSFLNSGVLARIRLIAMQEIVYSETGDSFDDLDRLIDTSDGVLDNVLLLRNSFAADIVVMITAEMDLCGSAWNMDCPIGNDSESIAYAVVRLDCATGNYSFGHELGHIFGAKHDWTDDLSNGCPDDHNHGHIVRQPAGTATGPWGTMMVVAASCPVCSRVLYWSNPDLTYPPGDPMADPMGTDSGAQKTDNTTTLNNTAPIVANYRCSFTGPPNVWMRDAWSDTGAEPDPATAGEDMWKSPYIWVRSERDANFIQQHLHQNPRTGSSNWIYVKLHNGAPTPSSGTLELYYANASTSLTWPMGWFKIADVAVTGFVAKSTRIVEQEWVNPPGPGHFCLLARWMSPTDPMSFPEGGDIGANVRNNNNLTWRNLNVVRLVETSSMEENLQVMNHTGAPVWLSITVGGPGAGTIPSFLEIGEVSVRLDESLTKAWSAGGSRGTGLNTDGYGLRIDRGGARLDSLLLEPGRGGRAFVRMSRLPTTRRATSLLDITEVRNGRSWGGVSFEIDTHARAGASGR